MADIADTPLEINVDIAVVGGGIAGGAMAILLAAAGLCVAVIERQPASARLRPGADVRTTAISFGCRNVLEATGVWPALAPEACPIHDIRIADGQSPARLHFDHRAVECRPFGWIVDNRAIRQALADRLAEMPGIVDLTPAEVSGYEGRGPRARLGLADGRAVLARLVIAADGRGSTMRGLAGIEASYARYGQAALVFMVAHEHPHEHLALEHFHPAGPFAVLPASDDAEGRHRSSVVWTVRESEAQALLALNEPGFVAAVQPLFGPYYGAIALASARQSHALGLVHARHYVAPRLALVADAAHAIHPIAGQGLNLGLRDVAALAERVIDRARLGLDFGAADVLEGYERARRLDVAQLIAATDGLNRLFSTDALPVRLARDLGLVMVERLTPLKRFFMLAAMGTAGSPPRLVRGEGL